MLKGIDHVAIAVADLDETLETFEKVFQIRSAHRELIESHAVEVATVDLGNTCIEFVQGKGDDSPVRKYVEKNGPGIHHIAFAVDNLPAAMARLTKKGVELIDKAPREGKDGSLVAFVHPRSAGRILYELVQTSRSEDK